MNLFNLFAKISIDDRDYSSKIKSAQKKFSATGDTISSMNKKFFKFSATMAGLGGVATKFGMDLEAQMSKVGAISGATTEELGKLTEKAKEMGQKTKFSATQSGEALEYMAMAGWKTNDMLSGIEGIMSLAAASGEDLAMVSDIVTDSMTAFGLSADKATHFADVLATASSNSNTNVSMLGESFKYVAPLAGSLGYSIEDTSKALGLMANAGIKGSMSGTSLKTILVNLAKPTKEMKKAMDKLGISMTNTDGSMKTLDEVMLNLRTSFGGLSKEQQAQYGSTIAGKEALSGLLSIVNASNEDFNKLGAAIKNSDGSADKMADTMQNNLKGSLTILGSSFEALGIAVYDKFGKQAKKAIDGVIDWLNKLTEKLSNGELDGAISGIASALAGIGTALLVFNVVHTIQDFINVFKGLEATTKLATLAQKAYNLVVSMNPWVLVITIIASVVAALATLIATNDNVRAKLTEIWNAVKQFFIDIWNGISDFFTETIPQIVENIVDWFKELPDKISEIFNSIKQFFVDIWNEIIDFFTETIPKIVKDIIDWFEELPYKIGLMLGKLLGYFIQGWQKIFDFFTETIPMWVGKIVSWFAELPSKIWNCLVAVFNKVVEWGKNMLVKAGEIGLNFLKAIIKFFAELPSKIWDLLKKAFNKVVEFGKNLGKKAIEIGKDFVDALLNAVKDLPKLFYDIGVNIIKGVWNGIKSMIGWITDKVKGFFTGLVDGVKGVLGIHSPSRVFAEIGKFTIEGFNKGVQRNAQSAVDVTENAFNNVVAKIKQIDKQIEQTHDKVLKKTLQNQKKHLEEQKKVLGEQLKTNKTILENNEDLLSKTLENSEKVYTTLTDGIQDLITKRNESIVKLTDDLYKNLDDIEEKFNKTMQSIEEKKQKYAESFALTGELFKGKKDVLGVDDILENSRQETVKLEQFYYELGNLMNKNFPVELIEQMKESGVKSINQLQALNSMTDIQMAEFNALYNRRIELGHRLAEDKFRKEVVKAQSDRAAAIEKAYNDYTTGLQKIYTDFDGRLIELAKKANIGMNKVGKDLIDGLVKGATVSVDMASDLARQITGNLTSAIRAEIDAAMAYGSQSISKMQNTIKDTNNMFGSLGNKGYADNVKQSSSSTITVNQYYNKPISDGESARLTRNELKKLTLGVS